MSTTSGQTIDRDLRRISDVLRRRRGLDLGGYKSSIIARRIWTRVRALRLDSLDAYARHLAGHPEETDPLLAAVAIKVTEFFRNPGLFRLIESRFLPELLDTAGGKTLRIWCAGCATGEEVYSLALLVHRLRPGRRRAALIVGTDLDEAALDRARLGLYPAARLRRIPQEEREELFEASDGGFRTGEALRRICRFEQANLLTDPAPGPAHLIVCRNVLIYLQEAEQERVLERFNETLLPGGYLALGAVERIAGRARAVFEPADPRERIYRHRVVA